MAMLATPVDFYGLRAGLALDVTAPDVLALASVVHSNPFARVTSATTHRHATKRTCAVLRTLPNNQRTQRTTCK